MSGGGPRVLYVCHTFPWVTQTFTVREVTLLQQSGLEVEVASFHRPAQLMDAQAEKLLQITHDVPSPKTSIFWRGVLRAMRRRPLTLFRLLWIGVTGNRLLKTTAVDRVRGALDVLRGAYLASTFPHARHFHAEFADNAATTAMAAADLSGRTFSFKSHSSFNPQVLARKSAQASFIALENEFDAEYYFSDVPADKLFLNRGGVVLAPPVARPDESGVLRILCVGTLQEKKGQLVLVEALRLLASQRVGFACTFVGSGPLESTVRSAIADAGLEASVRLERYRPHSEVLDLYHSHDVFVLPAVVAGDGDRDGLPNVLIEAAAAGCVLVSTPVSGIPELIEDGSSGLLVPERDAPSLAAALRSLAEDPALRTRLRGGARAVLTQRFDLTRNVEALAVRLARVSSTQA